MRLRLCALPMILLLAAVPAAGVTPHLVKDINPMPTPESSAPSRFFTVGELTFFSALDSDTGRELWRTDGTVAGTFQVADACPGECSGDPGFMGRSERSYFFRVPEQALSSIDTLSELWVTSGLPADTFRLTAKLRFPRPISRTRLWIASQRLFYFVADDGEHGLELWRSDGTPAGTFLAADVRPGGEGSNPAELTELNGKLFFRANDGVHGPGLWTSDGTERGTRLVLDPVPSSVLHDGPFLLKAAGKNLFFSVTLSSGDQLWKSDGTTRGSVPLTKLLPFVGDATVLGKRLLFVVDDPVKGQELWVSDGTSRGTRALTNFIGAEAFWDGFLFKNLLLPQTSLGDRLIFPVDDGVNGIELWITDGTPKGTRLLKDVCPGACSSLAIQQNQLVVSGNLLFFSATDGAHGAEPWVTDGTSAGTHIVQDLCPGSCNSTALLSSTPVLFSTGAGRVFFQATPNGNVWQLWRSDGTTPGTVQLTSFQRAGELGSGSVLGGAFLFNARDDQHGGELWRSGGTPESTGLLTDLNSSDVGGSAPSSLAAAGGKLYFIADDGLHGPELWTSDGTDAGTVLVAEILPGGGPTSRPSLAAAAEIPGKLVFLLHPGPHDDPDSLWRTDGTQAGTFRLSPDDLRIESSAGLRAVGNQVFLVASDADHGKELWSTDGTAEGTRLVKDLEPGDASSSPTDLTAFQGKLYFTAFTADTGRELWQSDGTPSGTVLVKDINPSGGSAPQFLTEHAGRLYFFAGSGEPGTELWSSDGTAGGTSLAANLPETAFFFSRAMISTGSRLFFSGLSGSGDDVLWVSDGTAAGSKRIGSTSIDNQTAAAFKGDLYFITRDGFLWKSDGTEAGTGPFRDRNGQPIFSQPSFAVFSGQLFFTTFSQGELFQSDGTPEGTFRLLDLRAAGKPSSLELKTAGPRLFFQKWDRATGAELWALEE